MFPSYLLNKGLKIKKEEKKSNIAFGKGPVCQLRYSLHQQHMIPTKGAHFISRHFLGMMHGRLNCQTVATLLIIAHRRLLFDKFREVLSFHRHSLFFKKMREIHLEVLKACIKAWIKRYAWKSHQMCETWQVWDTPKATSTPWVDSLMSSVAVSHAEIYWAMKVLC